MRSIPTDMPGLPGAGNRSGSRVAPRDQHRLKQRFEVKKKLGQGTYGKVQLAINKETGQEVAIKTIKKSKIESEQDLVRIRREIQIMSSIQHPHIIHIYEVFENKQKIVLVMQYASGGELYEYVSERKLLNDNDARRLFRQIATAVYYCHKNKVCHRDLKLENILLDEKGNAKIGDFGLSNVFDEKHFLHTFCGSPLYASPEIVQGIPYYGAEVDCWSLGVLLYTLVYGAMPFDGSNFKRLVKQISEASYYEPKQKSEASNLIRHLLSVDPTKRATIIDICNDCWVNKGYEHSLLQVADDLANLTPVRLDVLLALAPISPNATEQDVQHPLREDATKKKKVKSKSNENVPEESSSAEKPEPNNIVPPTDDGKSDEGEGISEPMNQEIRPSDTVVIHSQAENNDNQASVNEIGAAKRTASTSFDQSMTKVASQVLKRKKPRKSTSGSATHVDLEEADPQEPSSDYESVCKPSSSQNDTESPLLDEQTTTISDVTSLPTVPLDSAFGKDDNLSTSSQISSLPCQGSKHESSITPCQSPSNVSILETEKEKLTVEPSDQPLKGQSSKSNSLNNVEDLRNKEESSEIQVQSLAVSSDEGSCTMQPEQASNTDTLRQPQQDSEIESCPQTPEENKTKPWERRPSRPVGKISYPKFLENSATPEKKPVPSYGKLTDAKKMLETRRSSMDKDKERVIPLVKVCDAKRVFERRASMPCNTYAARPSGERKASLSIQGTLSSSMSGKPDSSAKEGSPSNVAPTKKRTPPPVSKPKKTPSPEKQQPSVSKQRISPAKEIGGREKMKSKSPEKERVIQPRSGKSSSPKPAHTKKPTTSVAEEIIREKSPTKISPSVSSTTATDEEDRKQKAKDIIKKNIAKAKLQELRQSSIESSGSTSSSQREQRRGEQSPEKKPQSYARTPQPFVREESKVPTIPAVTEIKIAPKPKLKLNTDMANQLSNAQNGTRGTLAKADTRTRENKTESVATPCQVESFEIAQPGTPSQTPCKAAPITRSYKKVTFTKDGACITETGKIVSEEGADGSFTRLEKKSKVTHYPTGQSSTTTKSEASEETRTIRSFTGSGSGEETLVGGSISPPISAISGGLKHSDSESSSGSTDIFDDIFDTWSGDPIFNNLSGRVRSMLSNRSPFSNLWGTSKRRPKKKSSSRAESCERKPVTESVGSWRRTGHGTDQECSDTDTDTEPGVAGGGLWKFLSPTASSLLDRHKDLFSRTDIGNDDFFSDMKSFSPSFRRSLSRDRAQRATTFSGPQTASPTIRMVINPLAGSVSRGSASKISPTKQDSLESTDSGGQEYHQTSKSGDPSGIPPRAEHVRSYSRTISRESTENRQRAESQTRSDLEDGSSSRRRVEQWLGMGSDEIFDRNHPISMYTTLRPRQINRYGRSLSSRLGSETKGDLGSPLVQTPGSIAPSNISFNTSHEIHVVDPEDGRVISSSTSFHPLSSHQPSRNECIIPVERNDSGKPVIHMKLSIGRPGVATQRTSSSGEIIRTFSTTTTNINTANVESADTSGNSGWTSPVILPESSSLLEQLRTHGYRNLVSQRLSGASSPVSDCPGESMDENTRELSKSISQQQQRNRATAKAEIIENGAWKCVNNDENELKAPGDDNHRDKFCMIQNASTKSYKDTNNTTMRATTINSNYTDHKMARRTDSSPIRSDTDCHKSGDYIARYRRDGSLPSRGSQSNVNNEYDHHSNIQINDRIRARKYMSNSYDGDNLKLPAPESPSISSYSSPLPRVRGTPPLPPHPKPSLNSTANKKITNNANPIAQSRTGTIIGDENVCYSTLLNAHHQDASVNVANTASQKNHVDESNDVESNRWSNSKPYRSISHEDDSSSKESVGERILRKSYYSRFNDSSSSKLRRSSSLRRRSLIESDPRFWDSMFGSNFSDNERWYHNSSDHIKDKHDSFNNSHHTDQFRSYQKSFETNRSTPNSSQFTNSKPPTSSLSDEKFFERVQMRAQKLIEEARERHAKLNSQLINGFRSLDPHTSPSSLLYDHMNGSFDSSSLRRTSSFTGSHQFSRSGSQTPTRTYSRYSESGTTSKGNMMNGDAYGNEPESKDFSSPVQVVTKAIQLLNEKVLNEP
ncbi:nuak family kinase 1 isoform X2 [Brevipalpus obovatus]|uniref:nuak family kinase 1 isoform X2 n=1 Tax=Brevipalpus obovatus TaxID=246614 RepID=UPI003D9EA346